MPDSPESPDSPKSHDSPESPDAPESSDAPETSDATEYQNHQIFAKYSEAVCILDLHVYIFVHLCICVFVYFQLAEYSEAACCCGGYEGENQFEVTDRYSNTHQFENKKK